MTSTQDAKRRRRQVGADRRTRANPAVPPPAAPGSLALGRLALAVTGVSWLAYLGTVVVPELVAHGLAARPIAEAIAYAITVTFLVLSATAYLLSRHGYLRRTRSHTRTPRAELEAFFDGDRAPSVTVLVPSFREQPEVIRQTVLSAALQEVPRLRVVLLIDDPIPTSSAGAQQMRERAQQVPGEVAAMLEEPRVRFAGSLARAEARVGDGPSLDDGDELVALAADYEHAVAWLDDLATSWVCRDHTDVFFVEQVLGPLSHDLSVAAAAVRGAALSRSSISAERMLQLRRRLVSIFSAELAHFERRRYLNLSVEPNKAMNLNSYIGLMGASYCEQITSAGVLLLPCAADDEIATLHVPDADYLVTLDADSVLLPEYCLRLIYEMGQPGNERLAVIQTPYSAFNGAPTRVERLAGATTDLQHMVHQGMAEHGAAFWVGANAVLRTEAVRELRIDDDSEGHSVSRFISDRTVIEDTESTLDLTAKGWTIESYPERLAYSASPPDFGSLCTQRKRWSNGGLIILGKLALHWRAKKERGEPRHLIELLLRLNYLASITWATAGLLLLLAYPFGSGLMSGLVVVMSLPYFMVMASDLKRCGYKRTDVIRIYGFNLIMLPVNAAGVLRSIGQMITGHKVAFARTPKVHERTVAPATFVLFAYLIVAVSAVALVFDVQHRRWPHAVFAGANLLIAAPAIMAMIGPWSSVVDVWVGFTDLLYKRDRRAPAPPVLDPVADWAAVLYQGSLDKPRVPHRHPRPTRPSTPLPPTTPARPAAARSGQD
ncbi:MAG: glycosyltransferase [Acidimicrobiales bacterium]|nr:glycosyltransferase [Acidimicrobiales bacterium]